MVSEDRAVYVDDVSVCCEVDETTEYVVGSRAQSRLGSSPKASHIQETVTFAAGKRDLLKVLLPDLQASLPECSLKPAAEGIEVSGPAEAVSRAKCHINEQVFSFKTHVIPLDNQRARLLQSDKSQQQVQELFSKARIQAVLSVRDDQLLLTAADDEQKSQASRILERNLHRSEIPVDDFHQEFLQSDQWKQFIDDLERNYTVTVEKETSSVVIEALGDCSEDVLKQVRDKLEDNAQQSDDIHLTEEEWELLKTYHQKEVEDCRCRKAGTDRVHVAFTKSPSGNCVIQVSGDPRLLEDVKTDVRQFVQQIVHKTVRFRRAGLFQFMKTGSGKMAITGIEKEYKCHISITEEKDMARLDVDEEDEEANETVPKIHMTATDRDTER
ncbi:hypothetical protein NP493_122g07082 [Ridgeia piscesae]|uniref:Uncharacterized protein n=1 Tax=Ridgeia piscesae TaxID=27915 RepID=A0AAD9UGV5_RIDPI|nr:hypothetical protein NP493_122g07082 [Ridgeia piscesae]